MEGCSGSFFGVESNTVLGPNLRRRGPGTEENVSNVGTDSCSDSSESE